MNAQLLTYSEHSITVVIIIYLVKNVMKEYLYLYHTHKAREHEVLT